MSNVVLCQAQQPVGAIPGVGLLWQLICSEPAAGVWRGACVHEHVVERVLCNEHRPDPGVAGCRACLELGHECPMTAELVEALA